MSLPKTAVFCWAGEPRRAASFLEEALGEWSSSAFARPLLVDCQQKKKPGLSVDVHAGRGLSLSALRLLGDTGIPTLRGSVLPRAVEEAVKKGSLGSIEDKTLVLLPERGKAPAFSKISNEFLFFAPAAEESLGAIRDLAFGLSSFEGERVSISIVVSGIAKIEAAAEFFLKIKEELAKLPLIKAELRFAGHFFLNEETERIAKEPAHRNGQLKAIGRRWLPSTGPAIGCGSLSDLADKVAALSPERADRNA